MVEFNSDVAHHGHTKKVAAPSGTRGQPLESLTRLLDLGQSHVVSSAITP